MVGLWPIKYQVNQRSFTRYAESQPDPNTVSLAVRRPQGPVFGFRVDDSLPSRTVISILHRRGLAYLDSENLASSFDALGMAHNR